MKPLKGHPQASNTCLHGGRACQLSLEGQVRWN